MKYLSKQYHKIKYKKRILYEWSICNSEWFDIPYNELKEDKKYEKAKTTLKLIMNRGIVIYKIWYSTLYKFLK